MAQSKFVKDSGYCWIVLIAAFLCHMIVLGVSLCFGIYIVTLFEHFRCTTREAAAVGAIGYSIQCLMGPLTAALYKKYGCRLLVQTGGLLASLGFAMSYFVKDLYQLYFTFCLVGVGFGLVYMTSVGVLPDYFDKYRYFATTFATVGSAVGTLTFSSVFLALINRYTWRGSMLINAGIVLQIVILGSLMKSRTSEKITNWKELFEFDLFKDIKFLFLLFDGLCIGGNIFVGFGFASQLTVSRGFEKYHSALLVSIMGMCNVFGRLSSAAIVQFSCTNKLLYFALIGALCGLCACFSSLCDQFWSLALTLGLFGWFCGAKVSQITSANMEIFGPKNLVTTTGFSMFAFGVGGLFLSILAGYIADHSRIENAYILIGVFMLISFCLLCIFVLRNTNRQRSNSCVAL